MYTLLRSLLFCFDAERAHDVALQALMRCPRALFPTLAPTTPIQAMGLTFQHPFGLAAGLDKNGIFLEGLAKLGFSFLEVGTVTPRAQEGNPKPRLFRLPEADALINRMGFNNQGVDGLVFNLERSRYRGILGINIGKNKETPLKHAIEDYLICFTKVVPFASYVTVNISSPNTPGLRELQQGEYFNSLLQALRHRQLHLADKTKRYVPLVIKISPDESPECLKHMAELILTHGIDGIIATNTTCSREGVSLLPHADEIGGLSGVPLANRATESLRIIKEIVGNQVTLIGVGGINSGAVVNEKIQAGADLLQLYTGLIYQGPWLIFRLVNELNAALLRQKIGKNSRNG